MILQPESIQLFQAIAQMRKLTAQGKSFSFIHSTYNYNSQTSDGMRIVHQAKLRPAARKDDVRNSDHKLFYYDLDLQSPRNCWQVLILFFNGIKVTL